MVEIALANEFSRYPAGRTTPDGPDNGRRFRTEFLVPALRAAIENESAVEVNLEGVRSFGSSFLEEAFGGLVRQEGFSRQEVEQHLKIIATRPVYDTYRRLILRYIAEAKPIDQPGS